MLDDSVIDAVSGVLNDSKISQCDGNRNLELAGKFFISHEAITVSQAPVIVNCGASQ